MKKSILAVAVFATFMGGRTLLTSSIANPRFPVHSRGQRARIDIRQKTFR